MKTIGKLSIILVIIFVISSVIAILTGPIQLVPQGFESATINQYEKASLSGVNSVYITVPDADVNVYPIKGKEFQINLTGTYAQNKYGSNVNLSVEKIGETLEVKVIYPNFNFVVINRDFNLDIGIPENYSGDLSALSASGDIDIKNLNTSNLEVNTASGNIKLTNLICENANIASVSGDVNAENIKTREKSEFSSVSGDVEIANSTNIDSIQTTSGNIKIRNYLVEKELDLESISGDVNLGLSEESSINLEFESVSGDLMNNFDESYSGENRVYVETTSGDLIVY